MSAHDRQRDPSESASGALARASIRRRSTAFGCILVLLFAGSLYSQNFLSPEYLLQQLKVASFLGIIATGMMIVILLGQIDLSVPWVITVGGDDVGAAGGLGPGGALDRDSRSASPAASRSASSTASASPICASPR